MVRTINRNRSDKPGAARKRHNQRLAAHATVASKAPNVLRRSGKNPTVHLSNKKIKFYQKRQRIIEQAELDAAAEAEALIADAAAEAAAAAPAAGSKKAAKEDLEAMVVAAAAGGAAAEDEEEDAMWEDAAETKATPAKKAGGAKKGKGGKKGK